MSASMAGRRVWITGASSGIGAALARELADRGARVAISARRADALAEVAAGRMLVIPVDVTDAAAMKGAAEQVREEFGGIDFAVLNAGMWTQLRLADLDTAAVAAHFDVNVMGVVNGVAGVIGPMLDDGAGTIAIVASVAGYRGLPGSLAYAATKSALITMAEAMRAEASWAGVQIVTVNPGFVSTPLVASNRFPMPFIVEPAEAARRIADGLLSSRQEIVFPLPMAFFLKIARILPVRVWTAISRRTLKKERRPVPRAPRTH